jgi:hypothetical protein
MSPSASVLNDSVLALATLQMDGVITSYRTNFMLLAEAQVVPEVVVTIAADDELAIERTRRTIRKALDSRISGVQITVAPSLLMTDDSFHFDDVRS